MQAIVILISGGGSNMQAIVRAAHQEDWPARYGARIAAVISNRADAAGLTWAAAHNVATRVIAHTDFADRAAFDMALAQEIAGHSDGGQAPWVVLAGFMRILTPAFVQAHSGRLFNIHPSLLPAFTGLHTHARALAAGCRFAGATVHRVTEVLDQGEILEQSVVPVLPGDSEASLAARVLATEHQIYPRALRRLLQARER
ncbi:MAG: phosphoribosylglycinamide formyltransferase [Betaproteobacteria bacterium]